MASNLNVTITNRRLTGSNVSIAQRAFDISATWLDDNNQPQSNSQTVLFPNVLANVNLPAGWLAGKLEALAYEAVLVILGIEPAN